MGYIKGLIKDFNTYTVKEKIQAFTWCNKKYISYDYIFLKEDIRCLTLEFNKKQSKKELKKAFIKCYIY